MPPRGFTLPSARTDSARAARSAFFCTLCQKGYSRQNEFEAHETSYDHQHKKRLKEMKEMQRQAQSGGKKKDSGDSGLEGIVSVKLGGGESEEVGVKKAGGFKKGGFRNAFAPKEGEEMMMGRDGDGEGRGKGVKREDDGVMMTVKDVPAVRGQLGGASEVDVDDEDDSDFTDHELEDYYDPNRPTDCHPGCPQARFSAAVAGV